MVEAIEQPKGNNLSIWEDDPSERKKNQSNRDIVNQEMISYHLIMIHSQNKIWGENLHSRKIK